MADRVREELEEILKAEIPEGFEVPTEQEWDISTPEEKEAQAQRIRELVAAEGRRVWEAEAYARKGKHRERAIELGVGSAYERWYASVWKEKGYEPSEGEIRAWLKVEGKREEAKLGLEEEREERAWAVEERAIAKEKREREERERKAVREREVARPVRAPVVERAPPPRPIPSRVPRFRMERLRRAGAVTGRRGIRTGAEALAGMRVAQIGRQPVTAPTRAIAETRVAQVSRATAITPTRRPTITPTIAPTPTLVKEIPEERFLSVVEGMRARPEVREAMPARLERYVAERGYEPVEAVGMLAHFWIGVKQGSETASDAWVVRLKTGRYGLAGIGDRTGKPRSKISYGSIEEAVDAASDVPRMKGGNDYARR